MTDDEIRALLASRAETPNLDYKEGFAWTKENRDKKYELIRDLMAMANTQDGGRVIFGVRNSDFEFVGVSEDIFTYLDANNVVQMLHANSAPKGRCEVVKRELAGRKVIVLDVAEFEDTPIICTDTVSGNDLKAPLLRKGAVYIRTASASTEEISSPEDMRNLIGRALTRRGDELLRTLERLMKGKPIRPTEESAEFFRGEIRLADEFLDEKLGAQLREQGYVELIASPTTYVPNLIKTIPNAAQAVASSEVALRGWNFPHTDKQVPSAFGRGAQSTTIWDRFVEGYRIYQSGLFVWRRAYWEDTQWKQTAGRRVLSFISEIYSCTEYMLFLSRLYAKIAPDATIHIDVTHYGCKGRALVSVDPRADLLGEFVSSEDRIPQTEDVTVEQLRASYLEMAARLVKHLFHVFNWMDIEDAGIEAWQKKLMTKNF